MLNHATGGNVHTFEFEIKTRKGIATVKLDREDENLFHKANRWGIFTNGKGQKLARASKKDNQVFLHKLIVDVPKGSKLLWRNGDTLDLRKENLSLVDKEGHITRLKEDEPPSDYEDKDPMAIYEKKPTAAKDENSTWQAISELAGEGLDQAKKLKKQLEKEYDMDYYDEKPKDVRGVYHHKGANKWHAAAFYEKKRYSLGYFADYEEAAREMQIFRKEGPESKLLKRNRKGNK